MWNQKDELFMMLVLRQSLPMEKVVERSLRYRLNLSNDLSTIKIRPPKNKGSQYNSVFIPIGVYQNREGVFEWYSQEVNQLLRAHLDKNYNLRELFGSAKTIDKLFRMRYKLAEEYRNVPGYFIAMMNPGFRLIRFESPDHRFLLYGLAQIDTIPYNFNFEKFIENMSVYRDFKNKRNNK